MNFSQLFLGSPVVENLGSMTAATPCPDEDAIFRFILTSVFRKDCLITSDTMLWQHENTTKQRRTPRLFLSAPPPPQGPLGEAITEHGVKVFVAPVGI